MELVVRSRTLTCRIGGCLHCHGGSTNHCGTTRCVLEIEHCIDDIRNFTHPTQGMKLRQLRMITFSMHRRVNDSRRYRVEPNVVRRVLAIGQRALLVCARSGNVLWDCLAFLDDAIFDFIRVIGGLSVIAISHPHFYTTMAEWSRAFDNAPIYLHRLNKSWVKRLDAPIRFWDEERISLNDGISLIRVGGHFEGSTVLHWPGTADGEGALLVGDSMSVVHDRRWVSFMRSYPDLIPLSGRIVEQIRKAVADLPFGRLYGARWESIIVKDAKNAVSRSVQRYLRALAPEG